jgi:hypothetical protein
MRRGRRQQHSASTDIGEGDLVVALLDGKRSPHGFPVVTPKAGHFYIVTSIYEEWYGLGCTLDGLNPKPYRGFFLVSMGVHYFKKVEPVQEEVELQVLAPSPLVRIPETALSLCPCSEGSSGSSFWH